MAECFCGCGRDLTGYSGRAVNKQGRRTVGLLDKLEATRAIVERGDPIKKPKRVLTLAIAAGDLDEDDFDAARERHPDTNPFCAVVLDQLDRMISEGSGYKIFWTDLAHGEMWSDARRTKKDWQAWGRNGMALCRCR